MCEKNKYTISLDSVKSNFTFDSNKIQHNTGNKFKLLPYTTKDDKAILDFLGVVGSFSRIISNKELKEVFNANILIEDVAEKISEYEGSYSREVFKDIIRNMFIVGDELVDFDIKTMNYIASTKVDEKMAKFLCSIFFDESLKKLVKKNYDTNIDNLLYKLVLDSLPSLKDEEKLYDEYKCYIPFIKTLFIEDFKFLIENKELYKSSLKRFLEYYYMFYVSQLSMKLAKFQNADLNKPEKLYYTLSWESTSKNRTAYKFGLELLENSINSLFSHAVTLELLNHHSLDSQLGYVELFNMYEAMESEDISNQIKSAYEVYIDGINDTDWTEFKNKIIKSDNKAFDYAKELFEAVEYQFRGAKRKSAYNGYAMWYKKFIHQSFGKKRGPLRYNLNITEEDIILMTKICIKDKGRLKINFLFDEFEARGMFFDRDSKVKIIQLYEKLNLLEKKSDSGDAQYVRSIL